MARWIIIVGTLGMVPLIAPMMVLAEEPIDSPSLELLEFLGDWETNEGEWQDPLDLINELDALDDDAQKIKAEGSGDGQS